MVVFGLGILRNFKGLLCFVSIVMNSVYIYRESCIEGDGSGGHRWEYGGWLVMRGRFVVSRL